MAYSHKQDLCHVSQDHKSVQEVSAPQSGFRSLQSDTRRLEAQQLLDRLGAVLVEGMDNRKTVRVRVPVAPWLPTHLAE